MQAAALILALPLVAAQLYANSTSPITTEAAKASVTPGLVAPSSTSADLTTYVTVVEGRTLTVTTKKATPTAQVAVAGPTDDDTTTFVTVVEGRTLTITSSKPSGTGVVFVNGGKINGAGVQLAALAGAAALLI